MTLGQKIRSARLRAGLSQKDLANRLSVTRETIAQWESDSTKPKPDRLRRLAAVLQLDFQELLNHYSSEENVMTLATDTLKLPPSLGATPVTFGEADLPVVGVAKGGAEGVLVITIDLTPIDMTYRPPQLRNVPDAFAVYAVGDSMAPMYYAGQTLWIHPHREPVAENGVLIVKTNDEAIIKQFVRRTDSAIVVREYRPLEREFEIPLSDIRRVYKIIGALDLR